MKVQLTVSRKTIDYIFKKTSALLSITDLQYHMHELGKIDQDLPLAQVIERAKYQIDIIKNGLSQRKCFTQPRLSL